MSALVPDGEIEQLVGIARDPAVHYGRADLRAQMVYVLHSGQCKSSEVDLRDCRYSRALDVGIRMSQWQDAQDRPVALAVLAGRLVPDPRSQDGP